MSDQPWQVFAGRSAPLADLVRSENERRRALQARVADEGGNDESLDLGTGPLAPPTVDQT